MPASSIPALSGLRAAVGVGAWATPNVSGRLFGLDPVNNPQASYLGRLFGACDLAHAAAGYIAGRTGVLPKPAAIMVTGVALLAAGMGAAALAADGSEAP